MQYVHVYIRVLRRTPRADKHVEKAKKALFVIVQFLRVAIHRYQHKDGPTRKAVNAPAAPGFAIGPAGRSTAASGTNEGKALLLA